MTPTIIEVTEDTIYTADHDPEGCNPIWHAPAQEFCTDMVSVYWDSVEVTEGAFNTWTADLPAEAIEFMDDWSGGRPVEPFSFTI